MVTFLDKIKYWAFQSKHNQSSNLMLDQIVDDLRQFGYVILDNFIHVDRLKSLKSLLDDQMEKKLAFETPSIAQKRIDEIQHKDLIDGYFKASLNEWERRGITFHSGEINDYQQLLDDFNPSTLKMYVLGNLEFTMLWLDPSILEIVESYMGLRPYLQEAYIRRNFPAKYRVMNHFWHRDTNHPDYLIKVFFFFTDCNLENGPHEYISQSIQDRRLDGKSYYEDDEVDRLYPPESERRIRSVVKAGTVVIEDTRGLHRAMVPESGYRDLGFAVFSPHAIYEIWKDKFYEIKEENYQKLTSYQKSFVPKAFITK